MYVMIDHIPTPPMGFFGSHFIFTSRKNWINSEWESIIIIGVLLVYAGLHIWNRVGKEKQKSGILLTRQNQGVWKAHVVWFLKLQRKLAFRKENVQQQALPPHISQLRNAPALSLKLYLHHLCWSLSVKMWAIFLLCRSQ